MMRKTDPKTHVPVRTSRPQHPAIDDVARALHPLDAPPPLRGWNHDALAELIGEVPRVPAAVLIALRDTAQPQVVFTLRRDDLPTHAGQVSFPGGRVEVGDIDAVAAALRESREEIGLDPARALPLGYLDGLETISGYCVTPVVARIDADARLVADPDEVAHVFEVPLAFLLDPANLLTRRLHWCGREREVYEYAGSDPPIWGATALMLMNLMQRMGSL